VAGAALVGRVWRALAGRVGRVLAGWLAGRAWRALAGRRSAPLLGRLGRAEPVRDCIGGAGCGGIACCPRGGSMCSVVGGPSVSGFRSSNFCSAAL
jgi:hypothetical protein